MSLSPRLQRGRRGSRDINELVADLERLDSYTVAALPTAAEHTGKLAVASNAAGGAKIVYSDGTSWKIVATIGATVA